MLLRARTTTDYDNQGRAYCTHVFSVDPDTGTVGDSLKTELFYDGRGDVVATQAPGGLVTTTDYDGAGRPMLQETGSAGDTPGTIGTPIQSVATQYDADGNPILVTTSQLNPDENTMRVSYVADWYNSADQLTYTANYGTTPPAGSQRPTDPPKASSTSVLVTHNLYNRSGFLVAAVDPRGTATLFSYDNLGRVTEQVQNWGSDPNATNQNVPTTYSYDGLNHILTSSAAVILPANVTYQPKTKSASTTPPPAKTTYIYGAAASVTGSKDLLREIDYPDGTKERYFYDALGELVAKTDRTGVQHKYSYDSLGNLIDDSVTNWGPPSSNIDETVAELSTAYDTLGRACLLTSYGPSGNVVNQVENVYDGLGNLVTQYQSHSGPVYTPSTETVAHPVSPAVQYVYKTSPRATAITAG